MIFKTTEGTIISYKALLVGVLPEYIAKEMNALQ